MIKRKNILAENMLRFRSKNIAAQEAAAIRKLIEQVTTEIDVKNEKKWASQTAALSKSFKERWTKKTPQVTGIIGPYYLASRQWSESGYSGGVFAFEKVTLGGSQDTGTMTLPLPTGGGLFVWQDLAPGTSGPGFNYITYDKTTGKNWTDENQTAQSVAKDINELYNQIPSIEDLRAIYNNDTNKATYSELIANFKTSDLKRNKKILPLLKGNAADFFNQNL
jgi:hypothetical protein